MPKLYVLILFYGKSLMLCVCVF